MQRSKRMALTGVAGLAWIGAAVLITVEFFLPPDAAQISLMAFFGTTCIASVLTIGLWFEARFTPVAVAYEYAAKRAELTNGGNVTPLRRSSGRN